MIKKIKKLFGILSTEDQYRKQQKEMEKFLSQAVDRIHLEQLENQWFKKYRQH